jgi:protein SCO1/2
VKQARLIVWALIAATLVVLGILMLQEPKGPVIQQQAAPVASTFGGPFTLVGADGKPFGTEQLKGKPYALFFGFTHCPDTCPTTLARLVKLRREAGGDGAFDIVFVTVDPERDGPKEMGAYAKAFGAPIKGLTGTPEQIREMEKQFGIFAQKVPTGDGDYTMDHTATVLLFDRGGKFQSTLAPDEQDGPALDKLKRLTSA